MDCSKITAAIMKGVATTPDKTKKATRNFITVGISVILENGTGNGRKLARAPKSPARQSRTSRTFSHGFADIFTIVLFNL